MALRFEQVEPHLHKWAWFFQNNRFEHWELINSAWVYGKVRLLPQSKITFASGRIRQDMIDYMRRETKSRLKSFDERYGRGNRKPFPYIRNFTDIMGKSSEENNELFTGLGILGLSSDIERKDLIDFLTNHSSLSRLEKLIIKLYYINGFTNKEVGKVCGFEESRISQIRTNLMERLKEVDYSRAV